MNAIVKTQAGPGMEIRQVDIPPVGPNDVLVKVQAVSLCGTDKHIFDWNAWAASRIHPPRIVGHEMAGIVVETGAEVASLKPGDHISSESHIVCGHCFQCRNNQAHICANLRILGVDTDGIFAEYAVLPQRNCYKNDPKLDPQVTCMQDAMGNAVYTALSGEIVGNTVAVIGCGAIGLGAIPVCKASGAKAVFATDVSPYRLDLAKRLGADLTLNPKTSDVVKIVMDETGGVGVDVVLEMSGHPTAIAQGFEMLRKGGRVSLLGLPDAPLMMDLNNWIIFKGATVLGINGRELFRTWDKMAALQVSGLVDFSPIVTHRLPFAEFAKGFELMHSGLCGKVTLVL
jgi:threonine 3-dehydrogenase